MTIKASEGQEFLVMALVGMGYVPAKDEDE